MKKEKERKKSFFNFKPKEMGFVPQKPSLFFCRRSIRYQRRILTRRKTFFKGVNASSGIVFECGLLHLSCSTFFRSYDKTTYVLAGMTVISWFKEGFKKQ